MDQRVRNDVLRGLIDVEDDAIMEQANKYAKESGYIKGNILYTIFSNATEHFTIAKVHVEATNEAYDEKEIVIKGHFADLDPQTEYYFYGELEEHHKFGLQFQVHSFQTSIPETKDGVISYLSSNLFHGIGKKTAENIVHTLGENAIPAIIQDFSLLEKVPNLSREKAVSLFEALQENQGFEQVAIYLSHYGIGLKLAQKIYEEYKEKTIEVVKEDPYRLVFDIDGFGFQTADSIASKNGLPMTHPNRLGAGFIYILQENIQKGHVYLPMEECFQEVIELLSQGRDLFGHDMLQKRLDELHASKTVIIQKGNVYLPVLYYAEDGFTSDLKRLLEKSVETETTLSELMKITGEFEETEILNYGQEQFDAIHSSLHSKITIVTGGPGTGKTTVIKGIIHAYAAIHDLSLDSADYKESESYPFVLTAPTGRAAKRLTESTDMQAVTIHRLLGWDGRQNFEKDRSNPLQGKLLIVDEFSMVDIWLANRLFQAIPDDMQILLVGDEDQLPSVGPGQVLTDLLATDLIPSSRLNEVYRQAEGSKIIDLAHHIKNDACTDEKLENAKDFSFIPCHANQTLEVVTQIVQKAYKKGMDMKDIQVLAPMYRTTAGIHAINKKLQEVMNPFSGQKREVMMHDTVFRKDDKVIQLINRPEDGIYNGDIGQVAAIFTEDENKENQEQLVIAFDEKEVIYGRKDYNQLMHAYCISIHKSQGSEFPVVILPVIHQYRRMLRKNLLYTAITRSKNSLIICGENEAFLSGVRTPDTNLRYTTLYERLHMKMEQETDLPQEPDEEDDGITPYDFM